MVARVPRSYGRSSESLAETVQVSGLPQRNRHRGSTNIGCRFGRRKSRTRRRTVAVTSGEEIAPRPVGALTFLVGGGRWAVGGQTAMRAVCPPLAGSLPPTSFPE